MELGIRAAAEEEWHGREAERESKIGGRARHTQNEKRAKEPEEILEDREEISQTVILLFRRLENKKNKKIEQRRARN